MKLWHADPRFHPRHPLTDKQRENRAALGEVAFVGFILAAWLVLFRFFVAG